METVFTHKDRKSVEESLLNISLDQDESDEILIRSVSVNLQDHHPASATEKCCHQSTIDLVNFLRKNPDDDRSEIVRRALKFLQLPDRSSCFPALPAVKEFVTSSVMHEISDPGKLLITDEIHGLSQEEKQNAEEMLLELSESNSDDDTALLKHIHHFKSGLISDQSTQMVQRFCRNINRLTEVLSSGDKGNEQKAWARGALNYIRLTEDAIPDDLGLIGLLDDMYIAGMAVRFIDPDIQPWEEVISDLYSSWPFLRDIVFTFQDKEYTYSEFSLINTALACPDLTGREDAGRAVLILPNSGITPFLVAFGAALGLAYDVAKSAHDTLVFEIGEKVRVDNHAVAIYDGVEEFEGQLMIRLKRYRKQKGRQLPYTTLIPITESQRLCRASDEASTRGDFNTLVENSNIQLSATEQIFHLPFPLQFNDLHGRVWLVSPVSNTRVLASDIHIYGHPLSSVLPIGNVKRDGEFSSWSTYFGTTESILTVIPDLDLAAEILDEQQLTTDDLILLDLSGTNRNKFASFHQIQSLDARVLCIAEEKDIETINYLDKNQFDFWEWSETEIIDLVPPNADAKEDSTHPYRRNDIRTLRSFSLIPEVTVLESDEANSAKKAVDAFTAYIRKTGDDVPEEFHQIHAQLMDMLFLFIRSPVPLDNLSGGADKVFDLLEELSVQINRSLYLSGDEKELALKAVESLQDFSMCLADENPKSTKISEILDNDRTAKIITTPTVQSLLSVSPSILSEGEIFFPWQKLHDVDSDTLIIPFWPGQKKFWDIVSCPPIGKIHFVLYSFEEEWRSAFDRSRNRFRAERAEHNLRSDIFPNTKKWTSPQRRPSLYEDRITPKHENTLIDEHNNMRRQRLIHAARKQGGDSIADTEAILMMFSGGAHAFFTRGHGAWSATHLLSDFTIEHADKAKIESVKADNINEHDVLVFQRGTDRDAIRELADANLPHGTRRIAGLWQTALRNYVKKMGISVQDLHSKLNKVGCHRHIVTVKQWLESDTIIAPRYSHQGDLKAIAEVTSDSEFSGEIDECAQAITLVWGEHLRASHTIANMVLKGIGTKVTEGISLDSPLDIGDGLILVRVEHIDNEYTTVPFSITNRLLGYD